MISCIPEYWILSGTLRLGVRQDRSHAIESFTSDNTESQGYKSDFGALSEFALGEGIDHGLRNDFFIIIVDLQVFGHGSNRGGGRQTPSRNCWWYRLTGRVTIMAGVALSVTP